MFKKIAIAACAVFSVGMLTAVDGLKTFTVVDEIHAVKAGTLIETDVNFECEEGYVLAGWGAKVILKNAAPEFFAKPEVKVHKPFKNTSDYDVIDLSRYLHFTKAMTKGSFPVRIDTTGMPEGDYAISIVGRFMKDGKSFYPGGTLYLTITEGDDKKFDLTPQEMPAALLPPPDYSWAKKLTVTGVPEEAVAAGTKLNISCEFQAKAGEAFGGRSVEVIRKNAPRAFFERTDLKLKKYPNDNAYDAAILVPYVHSQPQPGSKFNFTLDTTNFAPGKYKIYIQFRLIKGAGKPDAYPCYVFLLKVK